MTSLSKTARGGIWVCLLLGIGACSAGPLDVVKLAPDSLRLGLVAHWTFDDENTSILTDHSGNGHHGNIRGATWIPGRFGNALHFQEGSSVSVPGFPDASSSWSISLWVRPPAGIFGDDYLTLVSTEVVFSGGWELNLRLSPTDNEFHFGFPHGPSEAVSRNYEYLGCNCVDIATWTHLLAVVDGEGREILFYKNGELKARTSARTLIHPGNTTLYIGRWMWEDRKFFGDLDDLAIYNRALVPAEVRALFSQPPPDPR